ncbi:MAG: ATP-grasp domain-containing protein [Planctomycetota bacterium]|nr:ATP-grasp domain-containing protein [Planctomycetota bacterium]
MRVGIFESVDTGLAHGAAHDAVAVTAVNDSSSAIREACRSLGWTPIDVVASRDLRATLANLTEARADIVFQLAESIGGEARFEAAAAWLLEWADIPYTGSGPVAITLALEKPRTRAILSPVGVPTPIGFVARDADGAFSDIFHANRSVSAWIVKPSREDASHGIELASVVRSEKTLRERIDYVVRTYRQPALVEEFVDGREFNVSILAGPDGGQAMLPIAEIDYDSFPKGEPRLITFKAKWDPNSAEYTGSMPKPAVDLPGDLARILGERALAAWDAIGLEGYGRIDMRVHPTRGPLVLDVNPNPDLSPGAGLSTAATRAGLTHEQLIARIVRDALRRCGRLA